MYTRKLQSIGLSLMASLLYLLLFQVGAFAQDDRAQSANVAEPGVLIVAVQPESAAATAGLRRGDVVLSINEIAINDADALAAVVGAAGADATLTLRILHGDEERDLEVTLGERNGRAFLGVTPYRPAAVDQAVSFAGQAIPGLPAMPPMPGASAVIAIPGADAATAEVSFQVLEVLPDSPAAAAGVQVGESIVAIDGQAFHSPDALATIVRTHQPGDEVALSLATTTAPRATAPITAPLTTTRTVTVELAAAPEDEAAAYLGIRFAPLVTVVDQVIHNGPHGPMTQGFMPATPFQCECGMSEPSAPPPHFFFHRFPAPAEEDVIIYRGGEGGQEIQVEIVDDQI